MTQSSASPFKYYVGVDNLADIATAGDRVCVLNILGNESKGVTPVSHVYSGGNIVFGTAPGKRGEVLKTKIGNIPVYNNVREGMDDGHAFNVGVVYLPPAAVRDGVFELIRVNDKLTKIIILTEKVSVHDAREIRAFAQFKGIDVFGANSLGVADAWNHIRLGGALGGDAPEEMLRKGSVAIYSNSGNFTTTIASYLKTKGWGTTTCLSSGKDFYIHFGPAEFAFAFANDTRSKAAVLYVEPGGYYEEEVEFKKPVVACVVGRWKAKLTRAVGHAGAISGSGETAEAKENWFLKKFGVSGVFTPEKPIVSKAGAVVADIAHAPLALTAVMKLNGIEPDFLPEGNLELKPWFVSTGGLELPADLDIQAVEAIPPYREQIVELTRQIGAQFPRQVMKDISGCSILDPKTQVTRVNGVSILDASAQPLESNIGLALLRQSNDANDNALFNVAVASEVNLYGQAIAEVADAVRAAGNSPNTVLAAACCLVGPNKAEGACRAADILIELFAHTGLMQGDATGFDFAGVSADAAQVAALTGASVDAKAAAMLAAVKARGARSVFIDYLATLSGYPTADAVLAALMLAAAWEPLVRKRISRLTARSLPWYAKLFGVMIGAAIDADKHGKDRLCGVAMTDILASWSLTELACLGLLGERPTAAELLPFQTILGLVISNGVGPISVQGAKGAVSADGPETPERVQINKAMVGFLTHTGYAHGGNGYEGIEFLISCFEKSGLVDPGRVDHGLDLKAMATAFSREFKAEKAAKKVLGESSDSIPCINHPVFKGEAVNKDPREVFIAKQLQERGEYNVFHDFYGVLVKTLFDVGATKNVFCVNIDGVIAALLLKVLWPRYRAGTFTPEALRAAAFTAFLFGRMAGCAGEIDDHINRGKNMDTRTPASQCGFVS